MNLKPLCCLYSLQKTSRPITQRAYYPTILHWQVKEACASKPPGRGSAPQGTLLPFCPPCRWNKLHPGATWTMGAFRKQASRAFYFFRQGIFMSISESPATSFLVWFTSSQWWQHSEPLLQYVPIWHCENTPLSPAYIFGHLGAAENCDNMITF